MAQALRLPNVSVIREALVIRLARRITVICDATTPPDEVLRNCIGVAMDMDLEQPEFALLLSEVEARLGFSLTPLANCA